jgi:3-oxoacyl-[acyl-carrier-protein] synthase II
MINKISNNLKRRVVVTGMGVVSPLGNTLKENWENLISGKVGIRDLSKEKYSEQLPKNCKIGATIMNTFDGSKYKTLVIFAINKGN